MILFIKLLLSHFIGDFVFQPEKWVKDKEKNKIKSQFLYLHILVHIIFLLVILRFSRTYLWGYVLIVVSHYCIDLAKVYLLDNRNAKNLFFLDQLAHLSILVLVVFIYDPVNISLNSIFDSTFILLVLSILSVTFVSSVIIKVLVSHWTNDLDSETESLADAGKYIGMLERLFVFVFLVLNQWQAIGFLLAAKSIFRFGDLSKSKDRKLTEYVLIGTLLSFALAIGIGLVYSYLKIILTNAQ